MSDKKKGIVVTFGNLIEGAGKTTNSTMIAYTLSKMGYKVLLSDQDPQATATILYLMTKANKSGEIHSFDKTLMTAIQDGNLGAIITEIKENLFLLPSFSDFALYPRFLEKKFSNEVDRVQYFSKLVEPLKADYDFIFIDVPSTKSVITDSAFYASNFVVMILQTDMKSLLKAEGFVSYLRFLIDKYGADCEIMGLLPVFLKSELDVNVANLENAKKIFGEEYFFKTRVKDMERLKQFNVTGITDEDMHDKRIHESYQKVADEFILHLSAELERRTGAVEDLDLQHPAKELKLEEIEVEKDILLKKRQCQKKKKTTVTVRKSTQHKLNALVFLNKGDTVDHLLDSILEKYINTELTKDDKKKFDLFLDSYRTRG